MGRPGQVIAGIGAAAAFVATLTTAIIGVDGVRRIFFPPEPPPVQPAPEPEPAPTPPFEIVPTDAPYAQQLAADLDRHMTGANCPSGAVYIRSIAAERRGMTETSHGQVSTYLEAHIDWRIAATVTPFNPVGTGRGPAADADAYATLLKNTLELLAAAVPSCFSVQPPVH